MWTRKTTELRGQSAAPALTKLAIESNVSTLFCRENGWANQRLHVIITNLSHPANPNSQPYPSTLKKGSSPNAML